MRKVPNPFSRPCFAPARKSRSRRLSPQVAGLESREVPAASAATNPAAILATHDARLNIQQRVASVYAALQAQKAATPAPSGPAFSVSDVSLAEGPAGSTHARFTVTLSQAQSTESSVNYATANSSAMAGINFQPTSGTLTFPAGVTSQTINVPVLGNLVVEPDKTFFVNLSDNSAGTVVTKAQGTGTILNDDRPVGELPGIAVNNTAATLSAGSSQLVFTVSRQGNLASPSSVFYYTSSSSALAGVDYMPLSGTLKFAPGESTQQVVVRLTNRGAAATAKSLTLNLAAPQGATLTAKQAIGSFAAGKSSSASIAAQATVAATPADTTPKAADAAPVIWATPASKISLITVVPARPGGVVPKKLPRPI